MYSPYAEGETAKVPSLLSLAIFALRAYRKDKVEAVQKSLKHFEWLKAFAKANIRKHLGTDR